MSRFHERLKRRTLLKQGTALGTLLVLRRPKVVADSRTEVQAAPPREQAVGIRYLERFESPRGTAPDAQVTIELEIAVERLAEFLQQPARTAAVGGTARIGPTVGARFEQGALQAFATCERDPSTRQWLLQGTLLATDGRRIELRAERSLSSRSHRDAAADLARLQYRVTHEAEVLAQGEAVETPAATLLRIASLEVTGTTEPGEIARAKNDFLEFINGECEASYPELPKPFAALDRLSPAEWRALALSVLVMLPQPLPADGPSKADVVSNLERFVMHADTETFAQLRASLRTLGGLSPFLSGHVPSIQRFVEKQLLQKRDTSLKGLLDSLHKVAVLGYYSHPKADKLVGYRRPQPQPRARLQLPTRERPSARVFDVAIVGAGVAGSVLAERLTARHESVVLLEAGPYVPEMTRCTMPSA